MSENTIANTGDNNFNVQDLKAGRDITIIYNADGLSPEVKQKKENLKAQVQSLSNELAVLYKQATDETELPEFEPPDDPAYEEISWRRLLKSIKAQTCILFIGPEISVNSSGKSLHSNFYKELPGEFKKANIKYLENEGLFSPGADNIIYGEVRDYYKEEFPGENKIGRQLLTNLAKLPFSLIISLCPDDTMHRVLHDFGRDHVFISNDGTEQDVDPPSKEKPVVYNLIGNATIEGKYIFTYENFYEYLKSVTIPNEIKQILMSEVDFLFIGFDFSKWYNRLLLFILDLEQIESDNRFIVENKKVEDDVARFIEDQFKITFVENDYARFVDWLSKNAEQKGIQKIVNETFVEYNIEALRKIANKVSNKKTDDMDELSLVEQETQVIELNVEKFKKRITTA